MRIRHFQTVAVAVLVAGGCGSERARESVDRTAAPVALTLADVRQSLLENDFAEAFTITLEPGQSVAPHEGPARVVYALTDYRLRYTQGSAQTDSSWRTGDVHVHEAGMHGIENIGTTTAKLLVIARRGAELPAVAAPSTPPERTVSAGAGPMTPRLDTDVFRVSEVSLPAGAVLPRHPGRARVVYSLSDYTIRYEADGAEPRETTFRAGEAHWHHADRHLITNTGSTDARFLLVQFKR